MASHGVGERDGKFLLSRKSNRFEKESEFFNLPYSLDNLPYSLDKVTY